jgi:hypothetical protein
MDFCRRAAAIPRNRRAGFGFIRIRLYGTKVMIGDESNPSQPVVLKLWGAAYFPTDNN